MRCDFWALNKCVFGYCPSKPFGTTHVGGLLVPGDEVVVDNVDEVESGANRDDSLVEAATASRFQLAHQLQIL